MTTFRTGPAEKLAVLAAERGDSDALDQDEFDAAVTCSMNMGIAPFAVKPVCPVCGKRAKLRLGCLACKREQGLDE